jgi:hypothetical protein|tara:strand:- start:2992 stop:3294 length:303 start_codon:yes stop_codon:yes gene_type:complete
VFRLDARTGTTVRCLPSVVPVAVYPKRFPHAAPVSRTIHFDFCDGPCRLVGPRLSGDRFLRSTFDPFADRGRTVWPPQAPADSIANQAKPQQLNHFEFVP